jgi:hypothetical protein
MGGEGMKGYEHLTRCRVCKCTELEPCNPPCAWAPSQGDLCTNCADMIRALSEWQISAHRPSWAALKRETQSYAQSGLTSSFFGS